MPHRCGCHRQRGALLQHHSRFPSPQSAGRAAWILQSRLFPNWGGGFEHDAGTWFKVIPLATSKTAQQPRKAPSCSSLSQAWTGNRRVAFLCFRKFPLFECPAVIGLFFSRHVDILKLYVSDSTLYEASVQLNNVQLYHSDLHFKSTVRSFVSISTIQLFSSPKVMIKFINGIQVRHHVRRRRSAHVFLHASKMKIRRLGGSKIIEGKQRMILTTDENGGC